MPYIKPTEYLRDIVASEHVDNDDLVEIALEDGMKLYVRQEGPGETDHWIVDPKLKPNFLAPLRVSQGQDFVVQVDNSCAVESKLDLFIVESDNASDPAGRHPIVTITTFISAYAVVSFTPVRRLNTMTADEIVGKVDAISV